MKKLLAILMVALLTTTLPAFAQAASDRTDAVIAAKGTKASKKVYIVQMVDAPVVAYDGETAGYASTKPAQGQKMAAQDAKVVKYASYLDTKHQAVLQRVGGGRKLYDYRYTYSGFAAELSEAQAAALAKDPDVLSVQKDEIAQPDTNRTPTFLGLDAPGGLWEQLGGVGMAGEGIIVADIDTGIWPESQSFSDRDANGKLVFHQIPGWHGKCTPGEDFPASDCNKKLIGAQWFNQGYGGDAATKQLFPFEYISARDADGHGTHTASTAVGNHGVKASIDGIDMGTVSGMAPRARIASYKVCWGASQGGCPNSDSVAAIDQAIADGVDVINFSISGSLTSFMSPVEVAFLRAAAAGVFVAASAGNSGPGASTVAHNSPWLTTVAAGTSDRFYAATVTLGNSAVQSGVSLGSGTPMSPVVLSTSAGLASANPTEVRLCFPGTLDPAQVTGKIVVCDRGQNARTDKSLAVRDAGGVGMILANVSPSSLNADLHYVPTVHVDDITGAAIKAYVSGTANPTAQLSAGQIVSAKAPAVASFSSRGPALAGGGDLLKPDIMAPGVDILAAVSPAGNNGRNFNLLSGTSMSSPHIAGLAALLIQKHPTWSPAAIKSSLMTSASQTTNQNTPIVGTPFSYGAGQVRPNAATDPGLVYDAGVVDWVRFLCGTGELKASYCPFIAIDPSDLNYPSIAIGDLAGVQTVKRTVTNVGARTATYTVAVEAPTGISVDVVPATLTMAPGQSKTYTVKFTRTTATMGAYKFGALTWSDGTHNVRSPIAVRPVAISAPTSLSGTGANGSANFNVKFGFAGGYAAKPHGLIPATTFAGTVATDPTGSFSPTGAGVASFTVTVPAGAKYARFSLFDEFTTGMGKDDLDLYVYRGSTLVGNSGGSTAAEEVNLSNPSAGVYTVYVHGYQTNGPDTNFTLFTWVLSDADAGNLTVNAPTTAVNGGSGSVTLNWSGLTPGAKYLGTLTHHNVAAPSSYEDGTVGVTVVRIDP